MRTPLAPVETRATKRPPAPRGRGQIGAQTDQETDASGRHLTAIGIEHQMAMVPHGVGQRDAEFAGKMS
ncbi:hypothetical protein [Bradyrhizobium genosp. P]|uniref:hypothetical protein n=1 Tax=Bradyrhizobium genosp. P TaxID=83641 RepID=UPI003CF7A381